MQPTSSDEVSDDEGDLTHFSKHYHTISFNSYRLGGRTYVLIYFSDQLLSIRYRQLNSSISPLRYMGKRDIPLVVFAASSALS